MYNTEKYLRMDNAAQRALNVMPSKIDANDKFSLYGIMNRGKTAMARRLLKVNPFRDPIPFIMTYTEAGAFIGEQILLFDLRLSECKGIIYTLTKKILSTL
ncbi:MAG: hypothetical protein EOP48_29470 [Sphingobacteriales bacterium]|nr:MAG: hypothetical protein EOP48_29470 [Sphingobacteriales bacterium]